MLSDHPAHLPRLLEVHEVAYQLKRSQEFVRRLIRTHQLAALRIGAHWCVDVRDLEAYLDRCRMAPRRSQAEDRATPRASGDVHPMVPAARRAQ
jgi:excisionase family DNA binding protein